MRQYAKITPEGTKDYVFEECEARGAAQAALTGVFESHGYAPVMTPYLEYYDVFHRPSADWLTEKLYSVTDSRGRLLVMRPDNTLPIARVASARLQYEDMPMRLYYHQSVFRRSRFYAGHSDEYLQCGVELLGAQGLRADLEILQCAVDALRACGVRNFRVELGHAGFFKALADTVSMSEDLRAELIQCIESKNCPALEELLCRIGNTGETGALRALPRLFGGEETLKQARALCGLPAAHEALDSLAALYDCLRALDLQEHVDIDLGLVHGQRYYTGFVFRGYIEGSGISVLSGGRYDALLAEFGRPAAAVGFAVALEPLAELLLEQGKIPKRAPAEVMVFGAAGFEAAALKHLRGLNEQGLRCEYAPFESLEQAAQYAKRKGIPRLDVMDAHGLSQSAV